MASSRKPTKAPTEVVSALLQKTVEPGATEAEERAAVAKATQLIAGHKLDRSKFQFPPERTPPAKAGRRTIREACEELLRREPALPYEEIVNRVREEFPGCKTTVKCLHFYSSKRKPRTSSSRFGRGQAAAGLKARRSGPPHSFHTAARVAAIPAAALLR